MYSARSVDAQRVARAITQSTLGFDSSWPGFGDVGTKSNVSHLRADTAP
jgi:hypothetical protein